MRSWAFFLSAILCLSAVSSADTAAEISLLDGSKLKGRIVSATASEITVVSDLGVFRIPLEKLTPESRQAVSQATKPDADALIQRVAELEAKVAQLQQENEALRRQAAGVSPPGYGSAGMTGARSISPSAPAAPAAAAPAGNHTISSTGKRHNSGCRYFGTGRSCGPNEGIACKICGG